MNIVELLEVLRPCADRVRVIVDGHWCTVWTDDHHRERLRNLFGHHHPRDFLAGLPFKPTDFEFQDHAVASLLASLQLPHTYVEKVGPPAYAVFERHEYHDGDPELLGLFHDKQEAEALAAERVAEYEYTNEDYDAWVEETSVLRRRTNAQVNPWSELAEKLITKTESSC